jgi:transcription elongation factor Elf1
MAVSDMVDLSGLLDEAKCFELVRQHRWPDGVRCPDCESAVSSATAMTKYRGIGSATCARPAMDVSTT